MSAHRLASIMGHIVACRAICLKILYWAAVFFEYLPLDNPTHKSWDRKITLVRDFSYIIQDLLHWIRAFPCYVWANPMISHWFATDAITRCIAGVKYASMPFKLGAGTPTILI